MDPSTTLAVSGPLLLAAARCRDGRRGELRVPVCGPARPRLPRLPRRPRRSGRPARHGGAGPAAPLRTVARRRCGRAVRRRVHGGLRRDPGRRGLGRRRARRERGGAPAGRWGRHDRDGARVRRAASGAAEREAGALGAPRRSLGGPAAGRRLRPGLGAVHRPDPRGGGGGCGGHRRWVAARSCADPGLLRGARAAVRGHRARGSEGRACARLAAPPHARDPGLRWGAHGGSGAPAGQWPLGWAARPDAGVASPASPRCCSDVRPDREPGAARPGPGAARGRRPPRQRVGGAAQRLARAHRHAHGARAALPARARRAAGRAAPAALAQPDARRQVLHRLPVARPDARPPRLLRHLRRAVVRGDLPASDGVADRVCAPAHRRARQGAAGRARRGATQPRPDAAPRPRGPRHGDRRGRRTRAHPVARLAQRGAGGRARAHLLCGEGLPARARQPPFPPQSHRAARGVRGRQALRVRGPGHRHVRRRPVLQHRHPRLRLVPRGPARRRHRPHAVLRAGGRLPDPVPGQRPGQQLRRAHRLPDRRRPRGGRCRAVAPLRPVRQPPAAPRRRPGVPARERLRAPVHRDLPRRAAAHRRDPVASGGHGHPAVRGSHEVRAARRHRTTSSGAPASSPSPVCSPPPARAARSSRRCSRTCSTPRWPSTCCVATSAWTTGAASRSSRWTSRRSTPASWCGWRAPTSFPASRSPSTTARWCASTACRSGSTCRSATTPGRTTCSCSRSCCLPGSASRSTIRRRRFWARLTPADDGARTVVEVGGLARTDRAGYGEEFDRLRADLLQSHSEATKDT